MSDATNTPISIRPISEGDHAEWLELWRGYLDFYQADVAADVTELTWSRLIGNDGHTIYHKGFVAVEIQPASEHVIGFVTYLFHPSTWTANGYCYLEDLYVQPASRGQGVGRSLIDAVVAQARNAGTTRVYWHTDTKNAAARKLYDSVAMLADMVQYRIDTR